MGRLTTHLIERHYFEQFRKHANMPTGSVCYSDKPDVVITEANRTLGIEIARLYIVDGRDPTSEQVQSKRRRQVLDRAQFKFMAAGGRSIEFHVDFDPEHPILEVEQAAAGLAKFAETVAARPDRAHVGSGPEATFRFVYHNGTEYADAKWRSAQVHCVPTLDVSRLEAMVAEKTTKARGYAACDTYWLLLVVDFMDRAQDQEVLLPENYRLPANAFDQVLIFKPQFAQVVTVPQ